MSLEDLIETYVDQEDPDKMDSLFQVLRETGSVEEKEELADGYLSLFSQCQYDYQCGKFDDRDEIEALKDWVAKIMVLTPEFEHENYCLGHVEEMLSSSTKDQRQSLAHCRKSIEHFRLQVEQGPEDVDVLINLAQALIRQCEIAQDFPDAPMREAAQLYCQAMLLERKKEHQHEFFAFNGSGIHHFLHSAYRLLEHEQAETQAHHGMFISTFKHAVQPLAEQDSLVYYHWVDTLFNVMSWAEHAEKYRGMSFPGLYEELWSEIQQLLPQISRLDGTQEHFLSSLGHLFHKSAAIDKSIPLYETALRYYRKALELKGDSWPNPTYAAGTLQDMALLALEQENSAQAQSWFEQGLHIYQIAQESIDDFQLSLNHGEYLFEYARLFEDFTIRETLLQAQRRFRESREMGKDFYTGPYYGLAKVALRLNDRQGCLEILQACKEVFSNEYHSHDFREILDDADFSEVREFLVQASEQ